MNGGTGGLTHGRHLVGFIMVSDMGPDQAKCARDISYELLCSPTAFFFHLPCLLHQLHLSVRLSLSKMPSYFSSCAKIVNVWRAWGNAAKIKKVWSEIFGEKSCSLATKRLPPRPLRGRWGSIETIEQFLIGCGREELLMVYQEALLEKAQKNTKEALAALEAMADDLGDEEVSQYQLKMGRWTLEAIQALSKGSFWMMVFIGHTSRGPLSHVMNFIMAHNRAGTHDKQKDNADKSNKEKNKHYQGLLKPLSDATDGVPRPAENDNTPMVLQFVLRLLPEIDASFHHLLGSFSEWQSLIDLVSALPEKLSTGQAFNLAVFHVLMCFADFNRRIVARTRTYPLKLALLLSEDGETRKSVALDMLQIESEIEDELVAQRSRGGGARRQVQIPKLEESSKFHVAKLARAVLPELRLVFASGDIPKKLEAFIKSILSSVYLDTQEIEGMNSIIKSICKAAPNIHLPLLSSRLTIKKHIRSMGVSSVAQRALIVDAAAHSHQETRHWLAEKPSHCKSIRWTFPDYEPPTTTVEYLDHLRSDLPKPPRKKRSASEVCRAKMLLVLQTAAKQVLSGKLKPVEGQCLIISGRKPLKDGDATMGINTVVYSGVIVLKHYSQLTWATCVANGSDEKLQARVKIPVEFLQSLEVMSLVHSIAERERFSVLEASICTLEFGQDDSPHCLKVIDRQRMDFNLLSGCKCWGVDTRKRKSSSVPSTESTASAASGILDDSTTLDQLANMLLEKYDSRKEEHEYESHIGSGGLKDTVDDSDVDEDFENLENDAAELCAALVAPTDVTLPREAVGGEASVAAFLGRNECSFVGWRWRST